MYIHTYVQRRFYDDRGLGIFDVKPHTPRRICLRINYLHNFAWLTLYICKLAYSSIRRHC